MVYKEGKTAPARILVTSKPLIQKVIKLLKKESRGRISTSVAIEESLKFYLAKRGVRNVNR